MEDDTLGSRHTVALDRHVAALKVVQRTALAIASDLNLPTLLTEFVDLAAEFFGAVAGWLFMWDPATSRLELKVAYPHSRAVCQQGASFSADGSVAGQVIENRRPIIIHDMSCDPRPCREVEATLRRQPLSLIAAPLIRRHEPFGVVELLGGPFDGVDLEILTTLAAQVSLAADNAVLSTNLAEERERLLTIEREVHKKLARDLHDGPAQWLASIAMNLEYVLRLMDDDLPRARAELESVRVTLERTIRQIRNLMFELRPIVLESDGLVAAVEYYVDSLNRTEGMNIKLDAEPLRMRLSADAQRMVFDIIREALSNVKRHAHTSEVWVTLRNDEAGLTATVRDNGLGFDLNAVRRDYSSRGSLGMLNMIERAAAMGGRLTIDSVPGYGTTIRLFVPADHRSEGNQESSHTISE